MSVSLCVNQSGSCTHRLPILHGDPGIPPDVRQRKFPKHSTDLSLGYPPRENSPHIHSLRYFLPDLLRTFPIPGQWTFSLPWKRPAECHIQWDACCISFFTHQAHTIRWCQVMGSCQCTIVWLHMQACCPDLGVTLDSELSVQWRMNKVTSSCFHNIHRLKPVYRFLGRDVTIRLVLAFVLSRLDYCNKKQFWLVCQNLQLLHSSEHKMPLLVWWPALDS